MYWTVLVTKPGKSQSKMVDLIKILALLVLLHFYDHI